MEKRAKEQKDKRTIGQNKQGQMEERLKGKSSK